MRLHTRPGRKFRRFVLIFLMTLLGFLIANLIVWHYWTEELFSAKYDGGDLARTGYVTGVKHFRKTLYTLPRRHLEMHEYRGQPIDLLTIGDSFSFGAGRGLNSFYQDYIATINGITVMNVFPYPTDDLFVGFSPLSTLAILHNSGYLDRIKPRSILIESVERYCIIRFAKKISFNKKDSLENVSSYYTKDYPSSLFRAPEIGFVNNGNVKFLWASLLYTRTDNLDEQIYVNNLNRPLFSVRKDNTLVFLGEDIRNNGFATRDTVSALNDTFNRLADILAAKGIKLYFMPVVDKYNLYSEFIVANPYPKGCFFEELRKLPKRYILIDTKEILQQEVRKGEKDVYYADDTHWSWKASKKVFETVRFQ